MSKHEVQMKRETRERITTAAMVVQAIAAALALIALVALLGGCGDATEPKADIFEAELCERNREAFPDDARTPSLTPEAHVCEGGTYRWEWVEDPAADLGGTFEPVTVCWPGDAACAADWCAAPCADLGL